MGEEFIIKLVSDDLNAGVEAATGDTGGGGGGGTGGALGALVGIGASLGAGIAIATKVLGIIGDIVGSILRPVMSIMKGIFRLIGELLRPIVDILMVVLRPILMLLKPVITAFKTILAPFTDIVRKLGGIASQQIASGDITGAIQTSIEAFRTIIGPFVVATATIMLDLASTILISGIVSLANLLLDALKPILTNLPFGIGDIMKELIPDAQQNIRDGGNVLIATTSDILVSGAQAMLSGFERQARNKLDEIQSNLGPMVDNVIEVPLGSLEEARKRVEEEAPSIEKTINQSIENMGVDIKNGFSPNETDSIPTKFRGGIESMYEPLNSFVERLRGAADEINGIAVRSVRGQGPSYSLDVLGFSIAEITPR